MKIGLSAAVDLCRQLQQWMDDINESGTVFRAGFTYVNGIGIYDVCIGDICVWHSQADSDDDFTFSFCVAALQESVADYAQFLDSEGAAT